jgi:hypothetical protein
MALRLIVRTVNAAIDEQVQDVRTIVIGPPAQGKFEGADVFLREYPVSLAVRGSSASVLAFVERLNDPKAFVPVKTLRRLAPERGARQEDLVVAEFDLIALHIDPDSELAR